MDLFVTCERCMVAYITIYHDKCRLCKNFICQECLGKYGDVCRVCDTSEDVTMKCGLCLLNKPLVCYFCREFLCKECLKQISPSKKILSCKSCLESIKSCEKCNEFVGAVLKNLRSYELPCKNFPHNAMKYESFVGIQLEPRMYAITTPEGRHIYVFTTMERALDFGKKHNVPVEKIVEFVANSPTTPIAIDL